VGFYSTFGWPSRQNPRDEETEQNLPPLPAENWEGQAGFWASKDPDQISGKDYDGGGDVPPEDLEYSRVAMRREDLKPFACRVEGEFERSRKD